MKRLRFKETIDDLGRLPLPADIRKALSIEAGDDLSLFLSDGDDAIVLKKRVPFSLYCPGAGGVHCRKTGSPVS